MPAQLLDGTPIAEKIKSELMPKIKELTEKGATPHLTALYVGENAGSKIYMNSQKNDCEKVGIKYSQRGLPETATEQELIKALMELNNDPDVTGIILQMPLPQHISMRNVRLNIAPAKDVEGITPRNLGMLVMSDYKLAPCTAVGAFELLKSLKPSLKHLDVTIVGHSEIVGKPLALLMLSSMMESATPTVCHIGTKDLAFHTKRADVLFVAAGKAGLIKGSMIKPGAIVIDVGINRVPVLDADGKPALNEKGKPKTKVVGDVVFEEAREVCSYITPVPGGVGPLTVAMLLKNTVECTRLQKNL